MFSVVVGGPCRVAKVPLLDTGDVNVRSLQVERIELKSDRLVVTCRRTGKARTLVIMMPWTVRASILPVNYSRRRSFLLSGWRQYCTCRELLRRQCDVPPFSNCRAGAIKSSGSCIFKIDMSRVQILINVLMSEYDLHNSIVAWYGNADRLAIVSSIRATNCQAELGNLLVQLALFRTL